MVNKNKKNTILARSNISQNGNNVSGINNSISNVSGINNSTVSGINNSISTVSGINNSMGNNVSGINKSSTVHVNKVMHSSTFELNDFTRQCRKEKSIVLSIIRHNGDCSSIHCVDCPIHTVIRNNKRRYMNKFGKGLLSICEHVNKDMAIQWLINTYGEREAKEIIVEALI